MKKMEWRKWQDKFNKANDENKKLKETLKAYKKAINLDRDMLPDCYCNKPKMNAGCAFCEVWKKKMYGSNWKDICKPF